MAESLTHPVPLIGSFLQLTLSHNPGVAFGLRIPSPWQELLIAVALLLLLLHCMRSRLPFLEQLACGLILGGALANIVDRLADGVVTDFIQVGTFPVFNLADSAITIGAAMLLERALREKR